MNLSYYCVPYVQFETGDLIPHTFDVYELRDDKSEWLFEMKNDGDRLHNILARGIPYDHAKTLFYEMDE